MKTGQKKVWWIHAVLILFSLLTLLPFAFMVNNVFRSNAEFYHAFFSFPGAFKQVATITGRALVGDDTPVLMADEEGDLVPVSKGDALGRSLDQATRGPRLAWKVIRPYMLNTLIVTLLTVTGVLLLGSATAYILSRYRFTGHRALFLFIISTMMFPGVLTLVPSFLLVKWLGLLNTYWAMVLPYIAGGQVFAIFVFRSYFEGLPEDLFESARIDGAGHVQIYWQIVLPLSLPVLSVVAVMNILGTWNNFLWPFITNTEGSHHVISSGLFVLATTAHASNFSTLYAAYAISSIPLLVLFIYATRPFIRGVTSGAFKA
jgi:ABC-type glycerol-3-phosphate transport system permease component|tara:strand:+ start:1568 stop:2518 length:951 start_codon:yes stop_codon:yes gene_type:complete